MNKKILIINGNPNKNSLSRAIASAYKRGAEEKFHVVKMLNLCELKFDPVLRGEYSKRTKVEKDIKKSQELIRWADHLLIIYPVWWHTMPALMKGWFDKTFLPNFGFKYVKGKRLPTKLLEGKSAQMIKTSGGPWWLHGLPGPTDNLLWKFGTLGYMGIHIGFFDFCHFSNIRKNMPKGRVDKILYKAEKLGRCV